MAKKYTEEQLEELVIQLEEMCEKGFLPTHRCPVGSDEYKLAEALHNHRKQFSQKQKNRIEAAKKLAKKKTKRPRRPPYTAEQIENIVIRMEEMCSKGILPAVTCPKGSEELKLAYLVISHNYQFSPKQKKRIKTARSLAKKIIKFQNDKIDNAEKTNEQEFSEEQVDNAATSGKEVTKTEKDDTNKKRRSQKYTSEELENLVIQLEEMCEKGILPTHRCPVGSEEHKLALILNNHRDKFSQEQKDRIEAAKELAKKKIKRPRRPPYTAEQLEDIVIQMEEMCSKGILPTAKHPKGSEELRLTYLIMSHNHQFSPKQKKRIEAAKKLAKSIIKDNRKESNTMWYNQYNSEQIENLVLQMEEYSRRGIYPTTHFPKGSDELILASKIRTHMYQFSNEQLKRLENTKPNVIRLKENFKQYEEMFLRGHYPLQKYPKESPEYQVYAFLSVRSKRLSQDQKDYMFCARKLSKIESDVVYESAEDRLEQYMNNVIQFCKERNRFPFMNRKTEEQLYCQMKILLLGSYESQTASSFIKFYEEMTEQFKQNDKRHNSESRLMMTNVNASESIQNTPYVEAVKKYETKMDRLTEENRETVERILSDNMTRLKFEARCNALESVQTEEKFNDLMEVFDFWSYQAAYEIYKKKFGKELA